MALLATGCTGTSTATVIDKNVPAVPYSDRTSVLQQYTTTPGLLIDQVQVIQPLLAKLTTSNADKAALALRCSQLHNMSKQGASFVLHNEDRALLQRADAVCTKSPRTSAYDLAQTMKTHGEIGVIPLPGGS